jgi:beta-glucosidase
VYQCFEQSRDARRVAYYRGHLNAVRESIIDGAAVRGYFAWSLMDNLEWALGYQQFFGIVHVNYATQARTVKDSGAYCRDCIAANAVV